MKKLSFDTIGIAVLILLNLGILSTLFFLQEHKCGHKKERQGMHHREAHREKWERHSKDNKEGDHHHADRYFQKIEHLGLSHEQEEKAKMLGNTSRERIREHEKEIHKIRRQEWQLLSTENPDTTTAIKLSAQFAKAHQQLLLEKINCRRSVNAVLTKEQKDKLRDEG